MESAHVVTPTLKPERVLALRSEAERLERLLSEVERMAGPTTWPKVEELVQRLVSLYGAGLERMLACVELAGAASPKLESLLCDDELLSHLLMLHGLHPTPLPLRVARALEEVRPYLASHQGGVTLLGIEDGGTVRLKLEGTCHGCHASSATVEDTIRRAIEDAAPEVSRVVVEQGPEPEPVPSPPRSLVWRELEGLPPLAEGERHLTLLEGAKVLFLRLTGALLAYHDGCRCGASLEEASLEQGVLRCSSCGSRFDVLHGGRGLQPQGGLRPIPLLWEEDRVRIALRSHEGASR